MVVLFDNVVIGYCDYEDEGNGYGFFVSCCKVLFVMCCIVYLFMGIVLIEW